MGLFKGCLLVNSFRTSKIVIFNDIRKYFGVFFYKITGVDFTAQGHSPKRKNKGDATAPPTLNTMNNHQQEPTKTDAKMCNDT